MSAERMQEDVGSFPGVVLRWARIGGLLPALLGVGLLVTGCEKNDDASDDEDDGVVTVVGTWNGDEVTAGAVTRELDDMGYAAVLFMGAGGGFAIDVVLPGGTVERRTGVWRIDGGQLILDPDDGEAVAVAYTVSSHELTVTAKLTDISPGLPAITATLRFERQ
jgi:hypothetical protein